MENTLENQQKFRMQYYGQELLQLISDGKKYGSKLFRVTEHAGYGYLELTPLSMISDEDAIEAAKMFDIQLPIDEIDESNNAIQIFDEQGDKIIIYFDGEIILEEGKIQEPKSILKAYDYLRSKGYALPFMGLSVEQQIEYGWVKLKK